MIEQLAQKLVDFHTIAATNPDISTYGDIKAIQINTNENFSQTEKYLGSTITLDQFRNIQEYTNKTLLENVSIFGQRAATGKIKDCHGDLHSQHICFTHTLSIFDCIEFNDRFRYCDVAS